MMKTSTIESSIHTQLERLGNNRLVSFKNLRVILSNLTGLFMVTAILMAAMAVICFLLGEPENAPGFAVAFLVSGGLALALKITFPRVEELELRHAMVVAALAYLLVPALSAIPFIVIQHMSSVDAFFEGISGWTGSGLTMIPYPENSSHAIQLLPQCHPVGRWHRRHPANGCHPDQARYRVLS